MAQVVGTFISSCMRRGKTVVECIYRGGKVEKLLVTPESRRADVIIGKRRFISAAIAIPRVTKVCLL